MTSHMMKYCLAVAGSGLMWLAIAVSVLNASACDVDGLKATDRRESSNSQSNRAAASISPAADQGDELKCPMTLPAGSAADSIDPCFLGAATASEPANPGAIRIPVYFHIIMSSSGEGDVCDKVLTAQIDILNEAYAGKAGPPAAATGFSFFLAGVERKVNDAWFTMTYAEPATDVEQQAKQAYQGNKSALHVYTAKIGMHGWARWPWALADQVDGVVLNYERLPGSGKRDYNLGDVLVHEVGHWLGLFHIYERGCEVPGDCVADTFGAAGKLTFCQQGVDTCTNDAGPDPLENFMADTPDYCVYRFTPKQGERMRAIYLKYRS